MAGTLGGKVYIGTLQNGGLLVEFNPEFEVPADAQAAYDETYEKIMNGELTLEIE